MPIHDWSRVSDGMFHWFHQRWIGTIADWLNQGRLPEGFYAIGEGYSNEGEPFMLALDDLPPETGRANSYESHGFGIALRESAPKTRFTWEAETESYLARKDLIAVRDDGGLVAVIEIVSAGNKSSQARFRKFLQKTTDFLDQGVHLLVIDLFPPTPRDPQGIHQAIWSTQYDGDFEFHADKALTLASYRAASAGTVPRAFVEPIAVGDVLPEMPLFLWADRYINVDLEQSYGSAWDVYPAPLKPKIESAGPA